MIRFFLINVLMVLASSAHCQSDTTASKTKFGEQIFLPSVEIGYIFNAPSELSGGIILKTSVEYRLRNNNDVFFRLNYDSYNANFELSADDNERNVLSGTVVFNDLLLGGGYRFGDKKHRLFVMAQPGIKFYDYPEAEISANGDVKIFNKTREIFTTRYSIGYEYYLNEKTAITADGMLHQVWDKTDYWQEIPFAYGFSVGFITALF